MILRYYVSAYHITVNVLTIINHFLNMAVVRHLGFVIRLFGPPTKSIWWSLSLCKILLESVQWLP